MALTSNRLAAVEITFSPERLSNWQNLAALPALSAWRTRAKIKMPPNREAAIRLHQWNTALSMAFMASIQIFEIALRNKMHNSISHYRGKDDWWNPIPDTLSSEEQTKVLEAIRKITTLRRQVTAGRVVSELPLGFWVSLISSRYDNPRDENLNYWRACLSEVFRSSAPHAPKRAELNISINSIRLLRNNIAHHEPIVHKNLQSEYRLLLSETRRLCFETADWLEETSLIPGLLSEDWLKTMGAASYLIGGR